MAQVKVIKASKGFVGGRLPFTLNGLGDVQVAMVGGAKIALRENIPGGWFHRQRANQSGWFLTTGARIDRAALETSLKALREKHPEIRNVFFTKAMDDDKVHLPLQQNAGATAAAAHAAIGIEGATERFTTIAMPESDYGIDEITPAGVAGQPAPKPYTRTQVSCRTRYAPDAALAVMQVSVDNLQKAVDVRGDKGETAEYVEIDGFVPARSPAPDAVPAAGGEG